MDTIFRGRNLIPEGHDRAISFIDYTLSSDERRILLATKHLRQYRYSFWAEYYVWDRDFKTLTPVFGKSKIMSPRFSPDGSKVAFIFENNLYVKDLESGEEVAVTTDGEKNVIINGVADWVYEEEFQRVRYYDWSANGTHLAYVKFNEKEVPEYSMATYGGLYPRNVKFKYPKAGEKNSIVSVHIYNVDSQLTIGAGLSGSADQYIPRIRWTRDNNKLAILRMNRRQNELEMLLADANSGSVSSLHLERNKKYIEINDHWEFLKDKEHFLWVSEADGYNHIYLYDMTGKLVRQITQGEFDVTDLYGYDASTGKLYYQSAEVNPIERYVYSIDTVSYTHLTLPTKA